MPRSRILLLMLALTTAACGRERRPDVLLITVDTLRADHLGLFGYDRDTSPEVDDWFGANEAAVFERSYSTEASTSPSVISLLTGRYPQEHRVRLLYQLVPDSCALLPAFLPPEYQTAAIVSNGVLTDEAMGIAQRFDHYDDFVDEPEPRRAVYERTATRTTDAALRWIAEIRDPDRPLFLWVHYIDPHGPYLPPDSWPRRFRHEGQQPVPRQKIQPYQRLPGVQDGLTYVDHYDEEIAYTDSEVGRLLEGFDEAVSADDALLVFTADHGESMMEHERWFTHGYHVYEEIVRVPLMIRGPDVDPGRRTELVSGIDVLPTILAAIGAEPAGGTVGRDLRRSGRVPGGRIVFAEATPAKGGHWRAAMQGDQKWMALVQADSGGVAIRRRYDLSRDPEELRPGQWRDQGPAPTALLQSLDRDPDPAGIPVAAVGGMQLEAPKVDPRVDTQALEKLRSLGYVQ